MSISLSGSLRTCKVDTAWANKIQSNRFQNPSEMVCPLWNGLDTAGRQADPNSFYTKNAGCNNPSDRIDIENDNRPHYMEYINSNNGDENDENDENYENYENYENDYNQQNNQQSEIMNIVEDGRYDQMHKNVCNTQIRQDAIKNSQIYSPQFGLVSSSSNIMGSCHGSGGKCNSNSITAYDKAMKDMNNSVSK